MGLTTAERNFRVSALHGRIYLITQKRASNGNADEASKHAFERMVDRINEGKAVAGR